MQIPFNTKFMNIKFDGLKDSHKLAFKVVKLYVRTF